MKENKIVKHDMVCPMCKNMMHWDESVEKHVCSHCEGIYTFEDDGMNYYVVRRYLPVVLRKGEKVLSPVVYYKIRKDECR